MKKKPEKQVPPVIDSTEEFEQSLKQLDSRHYILRLYVSGMTPNSMRAVENTRKICEEHLEGRFTLEIIDIYKQPIFAEEGHIVAAPTLVKELPLPLRKFIGDMSQTDHILLGLDIQKKGQD